MREVWYFDPESPQALPGRWLQINHLGDVYVPHVVRIRKRVFSAEFIKTFNLARHHHTHTIYHFVYFLEGANTIFIGEREVEVRNGQLVLINPDVPHNLVPRQRQSCAFLTFMFSYRSKTKELSIPFSKLIERITGHSVELRPVVEDAGGNLSNYFTCLENEVLQRRSGPMERTAYCLAGLFNELQGLCLRQSDEPEMPEDVLAAQAFLLQNLDKKVTIKHLMQISHLSRSHLMEKFKQHLGVSPINYQIHERIEKSKTYLANSSLRVKEIAALCGFRSEYYFNKAFKQRLCLTPGQYRKSCKDAID